VYIAIPFRAIRILSVYLQNGVGNPVPIVALEDRFDPSLSLVWADLTSGSSNPSASDIMAEVTAGFTTSQLNAVKQVSSEDEVLDTCPQNYQLVSRCFAAVLFDQLPQSVNSSNISYTIRADMGLFRIDVVKHASDFEKRILPLQWALDSVYSPSIVTWLKVTNRGLL
jgi:ATP-binding cassette, subfamily A (ABC1), member 3